MRCKANTSRGIRCTKKAVQDGRCYQHHKKSIEPKKDQILIAELREEITALEIKLLLVREQGDSTSTPLELHRPPTD
jgi:hypothetical protein